MELYVVGLLLYEPAQTEIYTYRHTLALHDALPISGAAGLKEVVIGMAPRGRLNVLINIMGKPPHMLFGEFEGKFEHESPTHSGDVKYRSEEHTSELQY